MSHSSALTLLANTAASSSKLDPVEVLLHSHLEEEKEDPPSLSKQETSTSKFLVGEDLGSTESLESDGENDPSSSSQSSSESDDSEQEESPCHAFTSKSLPCSRRSSQRQATTTSRQRKQNKATARQQKQLGENDPSSSSQSSSESDDSEEEESPCHAFTSKSLPCSRRSSQRDATTAMTRRYQWHDQQNRATTAAVGRGGTTRAPQTKISNTAYKLPIQ